MNLDETVVAIKADFDNGTIGHEGKMGVSIVITGTVHSGRTTIASIIEAALENAGIKNVHVTDDETSKKTRGQIAEMFPHEHPESVRKLLDMDVFVRLATIESNEPNMGDLLIESAKEAKLISEGKLKPAKAFSKQEKRYFVQIGMGGHEFEYDSFGLAPVFTPPRVTNRLNEAIPWVVIPMGEELPSEYAGDYTQPLLYVDKDGKEYRAYYGKRVQKEDSGRFIMDFTDHQLDLVLAGQKLMKNLSSIAISEFAFVEENSHNGLDDTPFATANHLIALMEDRMEIHSHSVEFTL